MVSVNRLNISGYKGRTLKCRHFVVSDENQDVALVFPGLAYNSDMPLLYYSIQTILTSGINVLSVDYDYSNNQEFIKQSTRDRADWLLGDSEAALDFTIKGMNQRVTCMIGKSLGTLMLGHFLETREDLRDAKTIWLTPLIKNPELLEQMLAYMKDAVLVIGTDDPHYDRDIIDRLNAATQLSGIVIDGADHSLEMKGSITDSLRVLTQIVSIIRQFLE
ncbi:MAG: alpha/beta family hydrolase [Promethearchaeota archaeon]